MRIAPGIQWYGGSGILPDTCQRCETRNCEVSSSGRPLPGRSPGRAPRRSWRSLLASAGCPRPDRDLLTTAWHKYRRAFERSPSRLHASRRAPNESCTTAPAAAKSPPSSNETCPPGLSGALRNPATVSTYPGETVGAGDPACRRAYGRHRWIDHRRARRRGADRGRDGPAGRDIRVQRRTPRPPVDNAVTRRGRPSKGHALIADPLAPRRERGLQPEGPAGIA